MGEVKYDPAVHKGYVALKKGDRVMMFPPHEVRAYRNLGWKTELECIKLEEKRALKRLRGMDPALVEETLKRMGLVKAPESHKRVGVITSREDHFHHVVSMLGEVNPGVEFRHLSGSKQMRSMGWYDMLIFYAPSAWNEDLNGFAYKRADQVKAMNPGMQVLQVNEITEPFVLNWQGEVMVMNGANATGA